MSSPTGILSDRQILDQKEKGNIIITPFNEKHLKTASYDISLGPIFYRKNPQYHGENGGLLNPFKGKEVRSYWGQPQHPLKVEDSIASQTYGLPIDTEFILLNPHETILVHSAEFIGARTGVNTMCRPRSSLGRAGISVITGGYGDVGFFSRWALALHNTTNLIMILPVGSRIAQIVFFWTGETRESYTKTGQYQQTDEIEKLVKDWKPEDMLPSA